MNALDEQCRIASSSSVSLTVLKVVRDHEVLAKKLCHS